MTGNFTTPVREGISTATVFGCTGDGHVQFELLFANAMLFVITVDRNIELLC